MKRRAFLKTAAAALPVMGGIGHMSRAQAGEPWASGSEWKTFEVTTRIDLPGFSKDAQVWLPLPSVENDYLRPLSNDWSGNATLRVVRDPAQGTMMLHGAWNQPTDKPYVEVASRFTMRDRAVDLAQPAKFVAEDRAALEQYLKPTDFIPTDGLVKATALKCIGNLSGEVNKARAIYEWIVANTYRDGSVRGCGLGDIKVLLETGNLGGKCADLNALFVGLARAVGVPARDVYGIRVAPSQWGYRSMSAQDNITRAQHCRTDVFLDDAGWFPADPADVRRYAPLAGEAQKLLSPAEMGELFKVMALTRGLEDLELIGFRQGDRSGRLGLEPC